MKHAGRRLADALAWMILALALVAAMPGGGSAQSLNIGGANSQSPMEIFADEGIEWEQERKVFTARGNARAVRGEVEVTADLLRAYYREKPGGGSDIWRLDAEGKVKVASPGETAFGDAAIYDVDNAILVLTGRKVRFVTAEDEITADRQLEYWETKQMAVARGNAYAIRGERRLRADVLAAHFRPHEGKTRVHKVEAFDNVYVVLENDTVTADRAIYNVESGIATLTGSVKITRGENQLNGCVAEVNLGSGASTLKGCEGAGKGQGRVHGLIVPDQVRKK